VGPVTHQDFRRLALIGAARDSATRIGTTLPLWRLHGRKMACQ
jgi:hypothetical protein